MGKLVRDLGLGKCGDYRVKIWGCLDGDHRPVGVRDLGAARVSLSERDGEVRGV